MAEQTRRATTVVQTGADWHNVAHACDDNVDTSYAYRSAKGNSACHVNGFNFNIPSNATISKITVGVKYYGSNSNAYLYVYLRSIASGQYIRVAEYLNKQSQTTAKYGRFDITAAELQSYVNNNNIYNKNIINLINGGLHLRWVGSSYSSSYSSEVRIYDTFITVYYTVPYTVNFNGNGATGGSVASFSKNVGESFTLPANGFEKICKVTYDPNYSGSNIATGYSSATFKGWEDHGTLTAYDGVVYTYDKFDAPFYANTYADLFNEFAYNKQALLDHYVRYIVHGSEKRSATGSPRGVYNQTNVVSNLADDGGSTTLYAQWGDMSEVTLPTPTRDGYSFLGWYTSIIGGTRVGDGGASYTPTGDITLYARWINNAIKLIYLGNKVASLYLGQKPISKIFKGNTEIYYDPFAEE